MKKIVKFAAIAAAVLSLCVACQKDEELTLDGKQWIVTYEDFELGDIPGVIDLGYTEKGKISFGIKGSEDGPWTETGFLDMSMPYKIEKLSETSGVISYTYEIVDTETNEVTVCTEYIPYSELTSTTVKFSEWKSDDPFETSLFWYKYDEVAKVSTEKIVIELLPVGEE